MRTRKLIKGLVLFKLLRRLPGFPLIPAIPAALLFGAFAASLRALFRVRRLERRVAGTPAEAPAPA
jgi:hypothetical protein